MQTIPLEELPLWMRPRHRNIDWGLLILLGFCLINVWPFISHPLPGATDAELYVYRSVEVARLLRAGIGYSRWSPYFNYGYGSPLFNYLPPLPHYLAGYYQVLTDASPENSIKILFIV